MYIYIHGGSYQASAKRLDFAVGEHKARRPREGPLETGQRHHWWVAPGQTPACGEG